MALRKATVTIQSEDDDLHDELIDAIVAAIQDLAFDTRITDNRGGVIKLEREVEEETDE